MSKEHSLWVEKYRPNTLDNYVGNENIKKSISAYLNQNDIQNLIFYGPAGTGKTTLAKIIVKNLDCDYLYINASDERGIETIRDKVSGFASTMSFTPLKVIILDEADFLTIQAQASLRNVIETFSRTTSYMRKVLKELSDDKPRFNNIRQIIADANVQDFEELYRYLYDHAHIFALGKEGMVAYHINEYTYQSNFRIDKEINCMALINQLINV